MREDRYKEFLDQESGFMAFDDSSLVEMREVIKEYKAFLEKENIKPTCLTFQTFKAVRQGLLDSKEGKIKPYEDKK